MWMQHCCDRRRSLFLFLIPTAYSWYLISTLIWQWQVQQIEGTFENLKEMVEWNYFTWKKNKKNLCTNNNLPQNVTASQIRWLLRRRALPDDSIICPGADRPLLQHENSIEIKSVHNAGKVCAIGDLMELRLQVSVTAGQTDWVDEG